MLSSRVLPVFNTQDKNHTPRVLLTPQRACLVPQRGASERPGWDSSAGMELLTPSSPSWTSAHTAGQPLGQQQLDTCCSCVLGCVLWSLFTLTRFSRITSPFPFSASLTLSCRETPSQFQGIFRPAALGVPVAYFLTEFCTSLEQRRGYFSCHS